jgi:integrase
VLTDDEARRLFAAIDSQRMSFYSNKAIVDPVLFRVLYNAGLRVSEALKLTVSDVDTRAGTLRIRDSKNGAGRTIPITGRLAGTLDEYLTAAHPTAGQRDYVFYSRAPDCRSIRRPSTCGFVATWLMQTSRTSPAVRIHTRCVTGSRSRT